MCYTQIPSRTLDSASRRRRPRNVISLIMNFGKTGWLSVLACGAAMAYPAEGLWQSVGDSALPRDFGLGIPGAQAPFNVSSLLNDSPPDAARGPAGEVYVVWGQQRLTEEGDPLPTQIYLRLWDGDSWEPLGESASGDGISESVRDCHLPSISVGLDGNPWVGWIVTGAASNGDSVHVRRWSGAAWVEVAAGSATGEGVYAAPPGTPISRLKVRAAEATPFVEWEQQSDYGLRVFDGISGPVVIPGLLDTALLSDRARAGTHQVTAQGASLDPLGSQVIYAYDEATESFVTPDFAFANPQVALDALGRAALAWGTPLPAFSGSVVSARVSSGAGWTTLPLTIATPWFTDAFFDMSLSAAGHPVIALDNDLYRWTGADWEQPPTTPFGSDLIPHGPLVMTQDANGDAVAVWGALGHVYAAAWRETGLEGLGMELTGGLSRSGQTSQSPTVAIDASGNVTAVWGFGNWATMQRLVASRRSAGAWGYLGFDLASPEGIENRAGFPREPQMALDAAGRPVIAWLQNLGAQLNLFARRWDGSHWQPLGTSFIQGGTLASPLSNPTLAFVEGVTPAVAWNQVNTSRTRVYVRQSSGETWVEMGAGSASGTGLAAAGADCSAPALASRGPELAIAWRQELNFQSTIRARHWTGSAWQAYGGSDLVPSTTSGGAPEMVMDPGGRPVIAFLAGETLAVRRWNGADWISLPGLPVAILEEGVTPRHVGGPLQPVSFALAAGVDDGLLVAIATDRLRVARWDGEAWGELGTGSLGAGLQVLAPISNVARRLSIAADPLGNAIVAYPAFGEVFVLSTGPGLDVPGSANGDSVVDITDVVRIVNHLHGDPITYPPAFANADMDDSGTVDAADLEAVVEILLGNGAGGSASLSPL